MTKTSVTTAAGPVPGHVGGLDQAEKKGRKGAIEQGSRGRRTESQVLFRRMASVVGVYFLLLACAASAPHIGRTARPDNRLLLADLPGGDITWRGKDIDIVYKAAAAGTDLEISGFIEFSSNLAKYPGVNYFRVYLHFLDADGVVQDSKLMWAPGGQRDNRFIRWTFQRQWPMPPGAAALGFSYRGSVSEPGGDGSFSQTKTGWEVYQAP